MPVATSVHASRRIESPVHPLFRLVSEHDRAVQVVEGLEELRPIGPRTSGVGARFEAVFSFGPKAVRTEIELAELDLDRRVRWASPEQGSRSLTFEFRPVGELTAVRLTVGYERPDGVAAMVLAPVVEETVRQRARHTLERMRALTATTS
ncbi:MAG TPA: SRPBCC family protein [Acidimicrobiales bacterium]|nr:SRPBCC family protein [Acidimicrobiales bacterium]